MTKTDIDKLTRQYNRSRVIGTVMGEPIREGDIFYDAQSDTYKVKVNDEVIDIRPQELMWNDSYKDLDDYLDKDGDYIDTGIPYDPTGAQTDTLSKSSVRMRGKKSDYDSSAAYTKSAIDDLFGAPAYDNSSYADSSSVWRKGQWSGQQITGTKTYSNSAKLAGGYSGLADYNRPWEDPLADTIRKADNTVACIDMPEWKPDYNPNAKPKIYYHDRFPSIPVREIVNDAILMLRAKKQLNISIHSFSKEGNDYRLIYKVISDHMTPDLKQGKIIECILKKQAFDRQSSEVDRRANLKAKVDTNTFLKLRIAYLLYKAQKLNETNGPYVHLDVFKIIGISNHPIFDFWTK